MMTSTVFLVGPTQQCKNMWTGLILSNPSPRLPRSHSPQTPFLFCCVYRERQRGRGREAGGKAERGEGVRAGQGRGGRWRGGGLRHLFRCRESKGERRIA